MRNREYEREEQRQRRRAYYEQLSPEEKKAYREKRIRQKKLKKLKQMAVSTGVMLLLIVFSVTGILVQRGCGKAKSASTSVQKDQPESSAALTEDNGVKAPDWVIQDYIRINPYSRPSDALEQVNGVVVHYVANPGTSAEQNRDYFDGLADSGERSASSHFIIGIDGTVIQCIPLNEISYASNERNSDTISIECCHADETGKFSDATYESLVRLVKWLEETFDLEPEDVIRHYDVTGKNCPKYYVENPEAWEQFLKDIEPE